LGRSKGDSPDTGGSALGVVVGGRTFPSLGTELQTIRSSPYHTGLARRRHQRLHNARAFPPCCCPLPVSRPGKAGDPKAPPPEPLLPAGAIQRRVRRRNFALRPALPASLAGRYPRDYYGHSVAIGLAPGRRSHVRQRRTWQRDLGVPFASLHALTGHRSCAPEECHKPTLSLRQGPAPVTGVFPAGDRLPLPETGIQAIQLSPCRADPPARRPIRLGTAAGFLACCCPLHLSDPGQPSDPETTPLIPAR
jgi:hypothetical protein